jgi:two-component sensor histidine kinase
MRAKREVDGWSSLDIPARARHFIVLLLFIAALSTAVVLWAALFNSRFMPFFAAGIPLALAGAFTAWRGHYLLAVRAGELGFCALIVGALMTGVAPGFGTALAYLPLLALFCLYFDGLAALRLTMVFSALCLAGWAFLSPRLALGPQEILSIASSIAFSIGLCYLVGEDLFYAMLDKNAILAELHHRVRNTLQILHALSSVGGSAKRSEEEGRRQVLRAELRALRHVQDAIARSRDFRTLSMAGPVKALLLDLGAEGSLGLALAARVEGELPVETATPVMLILTELLFARASHPAPGENIWIELIVKGGRCSLALSSFDAARRPLPALRAEDKILTALISQLHATTPPRTDEDSWAISFDAESPTSFLDTGEAGALAQRPGSRPGEWRPVLGGKNRGRSTASLRKLRSFVFFTFFLAAVMALLTAASFLTGSPPGLVDLGLPLLAILVYLVARGGRTRLAFGLMTTGLLVLLSYSSFSGQGSRYGLQLYNAQDFVLFCLYFLGSAAGILASAWAALIYLAWFFLETGRLLPTDAFIALFAALAIFIAVAANLFRVFGRDLGAKEALALELRQRLVNNLDILYQSLDAADLPGLPRTKMKSFHFLSHAMAQAHSLVAEAVDITRVDMGEALASMVDPWPPEGRETALELEIDCHGWLPAEKALPTLLLVAELCDQAASSPSATGSKLLLHFRSGRSGANVLLQAVGAEGLPLELFLGNEAVLRMIETQITASERVFAPGLYSLSFSH